MKNQLLDLAKQTELNHLNLALQAFSKIEQELKFASLPQLLIETTAIELCLQINPQKKQVLNDLTDLSETKESDIKEKNQSPHKIWGRVLLDMSENNVVLHAMCVKLSNVNLEKSDFLIEVDNSSVFEILKKSENYAYLVACFQKLGYNYNIKITQQQANVLEDKAKLIGEKLGLSVNKK